MPFIGTQPEVGGYSVLDALTASATASYTLQLNSANFVPNTANQLLVSLNGVIQKPGSSFTVSGSTLTFSSALTSSDSIDFVIVLGDTLDIGTPSAGSTVPGNFGVAGLHTVNRTAGSDGDLIPLQKGGTTVGSIGTEGGYTKIVGGNGSVGSGLLYTNQVLSPRNAAGTVSDGVLTLGESSARFKDLYLSGGLYVGGTGSANHFDDYEEGTWTPALATSGINVGYSTQAGNYTKVGQEVFVNFQMNINSLTSAGSGAVYISGLPFTFSSGKNYGRYNIQTYNVNLDGTFAHAFAYASSGTTLGILYSFDNSTWSGATTSNFAISSTSIISGSFHYIGE